MIYSKLLLKYLDKCDMLNCVPSFCDARYKRYRSNPWEGFIGEESELISLISKENSRDIMLRTGKLLLWACIYIRLFWFTCFTYKEHKWLKWFLPLRLWFWKPFFQKNTSILFWHPIWRYWMENSFQTIDGKNMVYSKLLFKVPGWMWYAE